MGRIIYVAIKCHTPDNNGSVGRISEQGIFNSLCDAYEYIRKQYKATNEGKMDDFNERKFKRPDGSEYIVSSVDYVTDWDSDYVCWEINEFDLDKDIKVMR